MLIHLHKQATTTPKIRAAIQANTEPAWAVAERYSISELAPVSTGHFGIAMEAREHA